MTDMWSLPVAELDVALAKLPSVVTWSRLEPMCLSADLTPGLQALYADPLWSIGRQWQFGELRGEDGGSPVSSTIALESAPLSRLHAGIPTSDAAARAVDVLDESIPLEARVEAERGVAPPLRVRAEAGLHLLRLLAAQGLGELRADVIAAWAFAEPAAEDSSLPDRVGAARGRLYARRIPDAERVAAALSPLFEAIGAPLTGLPAMLEVAPGLQITARATLATWLTWYVTYLDPSASPASTAPTTTAPPAWNPHRLEYAFATQAELPSSKVVLRADEYTSGRLDWTDFDAVAGDLGKTPNSRVGTVSRQLRVPTPAAFPGMPADRLWAFEDARVYLGGIEAGPTDLTRMALVEFSLAFGVDWFVLPVDVPSGSAIRVQSLLVRDTFGFEVQVAPARQPGGWSLFGLTASNDASARADVFVVPPVVSHCLESEVLEEVALFRDEMANLVWGVERVVQASSGEPVNRGRLAPAVSLRQQLPGDLGDAAIVYRLMSPVPDHWVPFVAVPVVSAAAGTIELERRPLLHFRSDGTTDFTHPLGVLLRSTPEADVSTDRLRVAEEEVPRDGVVVTRRYQLARTPIGGSALWVGRRKRVGEGEGWSGLRFDTALAPGASG